MNTITTLAKLGRNAKAIVRRIKPIEAQIALMSMGFVLGDVITVTNIASQGGPIAVQVQGTKIALRQDLANEIEVELLTTLTPDSLKPQHNSGT